MNHPEEDYSFVEPIDEDDYFAATRHDRPIAEIDEPVIELSDDMLAKPAERPRDFERGMSYLPRLTIVLIVVNVLIFAWQVQSGALDDRAKLINAGALEQQAVVRGEVWRLMSSVFLHASTDHLIGNCIILFIVGMACEHAFGVWRTLAIYALSGLAGSLLSVLIEKGPTVGASGAIFGVLGCLIVFLFRYRKRLALRDNRICVVLALWAAYQLGMGFLNPHVANFAHLGGLLGGGLIGWLCNPTLLAPAPVENPWRWDAPA